MFVLLRDVAWILFTSDWAISSAWVVGFSGAVMAIILVFVEAGIGDGVVPPVDKRDGAIPPVDGVLPPATGKSPDIAPAAGKREFSRRHFRFDHI